ncbi:MAG: ATP synthase F1 subunit epsilon [Candidatus Woesebacteria bacterium]|nr:ATP synthase F1 subunit epsilon [Candidatus Woesebacteria bacterium]
MSQLTIEITTPERVLFKQEVDSATIPTAEGEITVLPNHVPLAALLAPGALVLRKNGVESLVAVSTGYIQVIGGDHILVLADTAERADELEVGRIEAAIAEARARAEKARLNQDRAEDESFAEAAAAIDRELARLHVARRHRSRGGPSIKAE